MWLQISIVINLLFFATGEKNIGAIFDDGGFLYEAAFTVALNTESESEEHDFKPKVVRTSPADILEAEEAICTLLSENIFGIFGPTQRGSLEYIQSIADYLEIPHIIVDPVETQNHNWSVINFYPHHLAYSQIFADIIEVKQWEKFTVIYEGSELLPILDKILTFDKLQSESNFVMNVVQLPDSEDFRPQLKTIKSTGTVNYLVDCTLNKLPQFLQQAQQVGLMSDDHSYILMNPDFQTIDIEAYKHGGSNITGIRFFDPKTESVQNFITALNEKVKELTEEKLEKAIEENGLTLNLALVYDAAKMYASAVNKLELDEGVNVTCDDSDSWVYGSTVLNFVRTSEVDGLTGVIKFDDDGFRTDFEVDVLEIMGHGFEKVGQWSVEEGYEDKRVFIPPVEEEGIETMKGRHFTVITALSPPYGMLRESAKELEGNDRYEGFGIELIDLLAKMNGFNYTFEIQHDGVYGSYDPKTGKATGMIEKVMHGTVDFAITDLTITSARQKAVDFTSPFMTLGITILYKKPSKQAPNLFSFISPFSYEVWGWIAGAYVGVSGLLFLLGRFSPEEWQNPYPCIAEPETLDNQFTLGNSFWFTLGSILTQGSEIAPIGISTRITGSIWWFFTLIMSSSYTANLAAFLTVENKFYAIKSVSDLAANPYDITYGAKKNGATFMFFQESDNTLYQKMYHYMDEHPEYMTSTNDEGLERVKDEDQNYAFLMESTSIDYIKERNCDVAQVGGLLDSKGYGIAMKKNSPFRQPMSESILQLQEEGVLTRLKDKWWKEKRGGGSCPSDDESSGDAQPLRLANVGGVFIVLMAGCGLATICAVIEMLLHVWVVSRKAKVPFREELIEELRFIFSCTGNVKIVRHREERSSASSSDRSGSKKEEKSDNSDDIVEAQEDNLELLDPTPTPLSDRSNHSHHNAHSRRQSNAGHIAKMRKYSMKST